MNLNDCKPEVQICPGFVSDPSLAEEYRNITWTLKEGQVCNIEIDATEYLARVIFDNTSYLGVEGVGRYAMGDILTYQQGEKGKI